MKYLRDKELAELKEQMNEVKAAMIAADEKVKEYKGMSEDIKEFVKLRDTYYKMQDWVFDLKDCGKVAA